MAITPVQYNINSTSPQRPYNEAEGKVKTNRNVKPLPPDGHLVHDRLLMMPKFFLKDFAYDLKAVNDGFKGDANDHKTGRLNDVGLKLGGIGIATMLAARTTNPMARIMEYAGLGSFLFAMSAFPKVAIQAPSRMLHGFDTGIEYIDDQGRKKSMFQDQNYIPFDMYQGEYPSEDLDIIGDRLGIPKDIHNRHDVIKEQMRKIAIQNNTLWMLTAGFATPVITALICCGMEKLIAPALEKARNANYNSNISRALQHTEKMALNVNEISKNSLSKDVEKILSSYKNQELPKSEYENIVKLLTKNMDANASEGIKQDLANIFKSEKFALTESSADEIITVLKNNLPERNKTTLEKVFIPSKEEVNRIIGKEGVTDLEAVRSEFKKLFASKIQNETAVSKEFLEAYSNDVIENISNHIKKSPSNYVSEDKAKDVVNFAKILGEFKKNEKTLDKCKSFKFEHAPETVLARSYAKFEKTLFEVLDIKFKDLKQMKDSEKFTQEILDKKLKALAQDSAKYEKAISKLANVMSEMDMNLHGISDEGSHVKDLITAIENNYNNTAKRLNEAGQGKFKNTIDRLVKEDVSTLSNSLNSRKDVIEFLDGMKAPKQGLGGIEAMKENARGVGSSKNQAISRIVERYQGVENSFNRILHLADNYRKAAPEDKYGKEIFNKGRDAILNATSSDHTLKLNTVNNPTFYRDVMNSTWSNEINDSTKKGLESAKHGNIAERFNQYITRFRDIIGNNNIDFTKPEHVLDTKELNKYSKSSKTRMAKFNLVAQTPVNLVKDAANRRYGTQKWLRRASIIGGTVLGATFLAQLGFGKVSNPHNLKKQVSDDDN